MHEAIQGSLSLVYHFSFEVKEIPLVENKCEIRIKHQGVVIFLPLRGKCRDFIFQRLVLHELTFLLCIITLDSSHTEGRKWWCSAETDIQEPRVCACRALIAG